MFVWKRPKINEKEVGYCPFKKHKKFFEFDLRVYLVLKFCSLKNNFDTPPWNALILAHKSSPLKRNTSCFDISTKFFRKTYRKLLLCEDLGGWWFISCIEYLVLWLCFFSCWYSLTHLSQVNTFSIDSQLIRGGCT